MLLLLGNEIVVFLYGAKWAAAGIILRILALLVFFKGHAILVSPLLVSVRGIAPDAKIKLFEAALFLVVLYPLTSKYGSIGAAWAGAIAFFVMMVNRLRVAALLLPDIAGVLVRTVLSASIACVIATTLGALAIGPIGNVLVRFLFGGSVIAISASAVMWILSPQLRIEFRQAFTILKTAKQRRRQNQPVTS
jgi:O-antigen/teichoic acid export membrane protein